VYFVQGILRLSSLAITFFEKDDLHMEPTQVHLAGGSPQLLFLLRNGQMMALLACNIVINLVTIEPTQVHLGGCCPCF
jgi:hypothetical protein